MPLLSFVSCSHSNFSAYPVFALAKNLGSMRSLSDPIVYALGVARDPVVQFKTAPKGDTETLYPFYKTKYDNPADGVSLFYLVS